jgi:hypothetical protein
MVILLGYRGQNHARLAGRLSGEGGLNMRIGCDRLVAFDPLLTSPDKNILSQSEWFPALAMGDHNV